MIRRDCLSKCRCDRAYCYCKSDVIHMFSDVIHVSTLLDIRPFLTIFGFPSPNWGGGWYTNVVPPRLRSRFRLFYVGNREGNAFAHDARMLGSPGVAGERVLLLFGAFVRRFCLRFCSYHYRAIGTALPLQRFRKEIALQDQQIFGDGFVVGHMRNAGQRQERVLASGRHQRLAQA